MIDPITASLTLGATRLASNILEGVEEASEIARAKAALSAEKVSPSIFEADFAQSKTAATALAFEKLFCAEPSLRGQLGEGPYSLEQTSATSLTLTSHKTGNKISLDASTPLGEKALQLANTTGLKNIEKGLELRHV